MPDFITAALEREKPPVHPGGWPTHRHKARNRRRHRAARRRRRTTKETTR